MVAWRLHSSRESSNATALCFMRCALRVPSLLNDAKSHKHNVDGVPVSLWSPADPVLLFTLSPKGLALESAQNSQAL